MGKARFLLLTQLANIVMVVAQMYVMDIFLGGEFLGLGIAQLWDYPNRHRILTRVFPTVTKCSMKTFGVSGKVVEHGGLCTLPVNIVNEKIYTAIWFWFVLLTCWSLLVMLIELAVLVFPCVRNGLFRLRFNTISYFRPTTRVLSHASYGDYILLNIIGANVDNNQMRQLLLSLSDRLGAPDSATLPMYAQQDKNHAHADKAHLDRNMNGSVDLRVRKQLAA